MQGTIRCAAVAGLLSACNPGDTDPPAVPDAPDSSGTSGLIIEWSSDPSEWPSASFNGISLRRARFSLESLRVVGDAAPGDPRTTASSLAINWDDQEKPASITFDDAPPGLYSQVALVFDGMSDNDSYSIQGRVLVGGEDYEFRIEDSEPLTFNLAIDERLDPGEQAVIRLRVNFVGALQAIDWSKVDSSDGRKKVEDDDEELAAFRTKLIESFEIVDTANAPRTRRQASAIRSSNAE